MGFIEDLNKAILKIEKKLERLEASLNGSIPAPTPKASSTVSGTIQFGGDLAATSTSTNQVLSDTTVAPGSYTNTSLTVDSKGRITAATTGTSSGATTYIHNQMIASGFWTITHGLLRFPSVAVVDSAGTQCQGETQYIDNTTITVSFAYPFSGKAYLN